MMVYPGPDGHHAGIHDGADSSGGRADIYREPVSGRAVPIAVQLEHDTPPVEPEITPFSWFFDRCQPVPVRNATTAHGRSTFDSTIKRSRDRATTEPPTRVGKKISLEDKDGARPYIKRLKKIKMGRCNKPEDGKR